MKMDKVELMAWCEVAKQMLLVAALLAGNFLLWVAAGQWWLQTFAARNAVGLP